ncbi:MAG: hypothetical protein ABW252_24595 [Polyangiales bacterium]
MGTLVSKKARLVLLALGLTVAACGGDDESAPTGGPSLGIDGGVVDAGAGGDAGAAACFQGKPVDNLQHLNKCATGCQPFDNGKRLPVSFKAGQPLPALP